MAFLGSRTYKAKKQGSPVTIPQIMPQRYEIIFAKSTYSHKISDL